jgi:hypothetical protein
MVSFCAVTVVLSALVIVIAPVIVLVPVDVHEWSLTAAVGCDSRRK